MIEGLPNPHGRNKVVKGVLDEVQSRYKVTWPFSFDLDYVLTIFYIVNERLADNDNQINRRWDETTAELARIIKSERSQYEFETSFEGKAVPKPSGQVNAR